MSKSEVPGDLLRTARIAAGMSQRELARKARTAQSVVARIELGETNPTWATLVRLLMAAGFTLSAELERVPGTLSALRGRNWKRVALARADAYGVDVNLLRGGMGTSVSKRLERLDQSAAFIQELRRATAASRPRRRMLKRSVLAR